MGIRSEWAPLWGWIIIGFTNWSPAHVCPLRVAITALKRISLFGFVKHAPEEGEAGVWQTTAAQHKNVTAIAIQCAERGGVFLNFFCDHSLVQQRGVDRCVVVVCVVLGVGMPRGYCKFVRTEFSFLCFSFFLFIFFKTNSCVAPSRCCKSWGVLGGAVQLGVSGAALMVGADESFWVRGWSGAPAPKQRSDWTEPRTPSKSPAPSLLRLAANDVRLLCLRHLGVSLNIVLIIVVVVIIIGPSSVSELLVYKWYYCIWAKTGCSWNIEDCVWQCCMKIVCVSVACFCWTSSG